MDITITTSTPSHLHKGKGQTFKFLITAINESESGFVLLRTNILINDITRADRN